MADNAKWYVVHTYSGYENTVAASIEKAVENRGLRDLIQEVSIPLETVTEITDNGPKTVERKVFPGYVLVKMVMTDDTWHLVRNIRGATGFVGSGNKAIPLPDEEIAALGQHGINIAAFTKEFNERTKNDVGLIIPVVITVYADRSFTFITKTPPAAVLIKKACNIESGSGVPNKTKVATISKEDVRKIAETKMPDLNAAMSMIAGTARSMGIVVGD